MERATRKVDDGKLVDVGVVTDREAIVDVEIAGDFFAHPESVIGEIERRLRDERIDGAETTIQTVIEESDARLVGVDPETIAELIRVAGGQA
jgi:hypothetical protein